MFFKTNPEWPSQLTSYDLLKSFAVITMIIDHVGAYLLPEVEELRMIGRLSMPVWLFLVGFAKSRDLSARMWVGALILTLMDVFIGASILSFNILVTIILARLILDGVMNAYFQKLEGKVFILIGFILLIYPSGFFFDYGTHAFLFAMVGYLVRNRDQFNISWTHICAFTAISVFVHSLFQSVTFELQPLEGFIVLVGMIMTCFGMLLFKSDTYPKLSASLPQIAQYPLKFMGRYSLEAYVLHLIIIQGVAFFIYPDQYELFRIKWF